MSLNSIVILQFSLKSWKIWRVPLFLEQICEKKYAKCNWLGYVSVLFFQYNTIQYMFHLRYVYVQCFIVKIGLKITFKEKIVNASFWLIENDQVFWHRFLSNQSTKYSIKCSFFAESPIKNEKDLLFGCWSNCVWFLTLLNTNSPTPIHTCITVFVTKERNTCHSLEGSVIQYCN